MADQVVLDIGGGEKPKTLMEKLQERYNDPEADRRHKIAAQRWVRYLVVFQTPTQLFMYYYYIIPYLFEDYDDWTQYYLKVAVTYSAIQGVVNYLCTIHYDTSISTSKDRPGLLELTDRWNNPPDHFVSLGNQNGSAILMEAPDADESGFETKHCEICNIYQPPRTHHCNLCKVCILKRDHHCYMVGKCIGFKNQRYFVVLTFYAMLIGLIGGYFQYKYLQVFYYPVCYAWTDFIPPVALYRWMFGRVDTLSLHICIMIIHVYLEFLFGLIGFVYFNTQMIMISKGKTMYELTKFVPIRNLNNINRNFRSVFGDFWALNFLFPMQVLFPQRDDGKSWEGIKLDQNANLQSKTN